MVESEVNLTKGPTMRLSSARGLREEMAAHVSDQPTGLQGAPARGRQKNSPSRRNCAQWSGRTTIPYRGQLPPDSHSLSFKRIHDSQPALRPPGFEKAKHLKSYIGSSGLFEKILWSMSGKIPFTGTKTTAWCFARAAWAARQIFGAGSLFASPDLRLQSERSRRFSAKNWPISYSDIAPYYDKVDLYLGITGVKENLSRTFPDSIFQRPTKLNCAEVTLKRQPRQNGPRPHPISRWGHHRWTQAQ